MNSVALIGRLTADPTCHAGESHVSATFRLAVPRPGSDQADFVDIVCFDALAGTCADWLTKGREMAVVGRLRQNTWATAEGEKRSKIQVVADAVQFLGAPTKTGSPDGAVAEPDVKPTAKATDRPAVGAYRRKAG